MIPAEILSHIRQIEFGTRRMINSVMAGAYHSTFKGNGMEFAEVREYLPGDDVRSIDWNVTARTGKPHIKQFVEERELTLLLMVDVSASGQFGSLNHSKSEVMATLSALLAFAAIKNNDKVGLMIFSEEPELFIPPAKGRKHVLRLIREILCFETDKKGTNIKVAMEQANKLLKRKAVVVMLSDFQDEGYDRAMQMLNRKHEFFAIGVNDRRESELPNVGMVELKDLESGETHLVDTGSKKVREAYKLNARKRNESIKRFFKKQSVDLVSVEIKENYKATAAPLLEYFTRRSGR